MVFPGVVRKSVLVVIGGSIIVPGWVSGDTLYDKQFKDRMEQAIAGDRKAQYKLGLAYLRGSEVKVSLGKTIHWFKKAANKGHVKAMHKLGVIYSTDQYGYKNRKLAFQMFKRAADKNHGLSQYEIARLYSSGLGVARNAENAKRYARLASKNNIADGRYLLEKLNKTTKTTKTKKVTKKASGSTRHNNTNIARSKKPFDLGSIKFVNANTTRKYLMSGKWNKNGLPAKYLPSNKNLCQIAGSNIKCLSEKLQMENDTFRGIFRVHSLISNIHSKGSFNINYRLEYLSVSPIEKSEFEAEDEVPNLGWEKSRSRLRCKILGSNKVKCYSDNLQIERFYRQKI